MGRALIIWSGEQLGPQLHAGERFDPAKSCPTMQDAARLPYQPARGFWTANQRADGSCVHLDLFAAGSADVLEYRPSTLSAPLPLFSSPYCDH